MTQVSFSQLKLYLGFIDYLQNMLILLYFLFSPRICAFCLKKFCFGVPFDENKNLKQAWLLARKQCPVWFHPLKENITLKNVSLLNEPSDKYKQSFESFESVTVLNTIIKRILGTIFNSRHFHSDFEPHIQYPSSFKEWKI